MHRISLIHALTLLLFVGGACLLSHPALAGHCLRTMPADTLRPDTIAAPPARNGLTIDPAQRLLTPADRQRIRRQTVKQDRRLTFDSYRQGVGDVMPYVILGLQGFSAIFSLWLAIVFLGAGANPGAGAAAGFFSGFARTLGTAFLIIGLAGLVLFIIRLVRFIRASRSARPG